MARLAGAAAKDDSTAVPESSAQSIELVDYPSAPPARPSLVDHESGPGKPGRTSIDRLGIVGWEHGSPRDSRDLDPRLVKFWTEALRRRSLDPRSAGKEPKMKFSHSLQFNAVPDWSAYYIAYSNLKKLFVTFSAKTSCVTW